MKAGRIFLGMLAGNAAGALACALAMWLMSLSRGLEGLIGYPSLLLIPFIIGLVASWVWRPLSLGTGATLLHSFLCTLLGIGGAWFFMHEGIVCLVIVLPILYLCTAVGALVGQKWLRKKHDRMNLCLAPIFVLAVAVEPTLREPRTSVVTDEILIAAPPAKVWPHVLAFPEITEPPDYWIFRLGLPYPTKTTNGGDFVGADRQCIFSDGIVIKERVAEFIPGKRLTFDIVEQPTDPEAYGHITLHRGQFDLRDNGDGTTTLIGSSWYSLHVRPLWYFDVWTRDMTRAVHLRVMKHVKRLSESGG